MVWSRSSHADPGASLRLSGNEKKLLAVSLLLLPATVAAHRALGFRRLQRLLERLLPDSRRPRKSDAEDLKLAQSVSRVVQIASHRGILHPSCLQQSIYLRWLLARKGLAADLRIGVRKRNNRFEAHAWIEYRGRVLNDSADVQTRYRPLTDTIGASRTGNA